VDLDFYILATYWKLDHQNLVNFSFFKTWQIWPKLVMKILLCIGQDHTFQVKFRNFFAKNPIKTLHGSHFGHF
jgi:hypothetical protein